MISRSLLCALLERAHEEIEELLVEQARFGENCNDYDIKIAFVNGQIVLLDTLIECIALALLDDANKLDSDD